jgi:hypothetical protein
MVAADTVYTLYRATEAVWERVTPHMELGSGSGPGRLPSCRTSSLAPMAADAAVVTTCLSVVVLPMEDLAVVTAWTGLVVLDVDLE